MATNRSLSVLVVVLALAVGYFAGVDRHESPTGQARAGSPLIYADGVLTTGSEGGTLTVWDMKDGRPVRATSYSLQNEWDRTVPGPASKVTQWLETTVYAPKPDEAGGK